VAAQAAVFIQMQPLVVAVAVVKVIQALALMLEELEQLIKVLLVGMAVATKQQAAQEVLEEVPTQLEQQALITQQQQEQQE
jgi:hypothetical protein